MEGTISNPLNTRYAPYLQTRSCMWSRIHCRWHHGRIAVVTGGNRGIGLEVCRQLATNGVTVVLTAIDEKMAEDAVEKLKDQGLSDVLAHHLDITNTSSIARLAGFLKTRFGKLDILVNRPNYLSKRLIQMVGV
jgi:NAD(P)-dependent dehydrogenase (short-subunit alcohol dehydrogenase family)